MKKKWNLQDEQLNELNSAIYQNQLDAFNYAYALQQERIVVLKNELKDYKRVHGKFLKTNSTSSTTRKD